MDKKIISNPVYEAIQPATLTREPVAKSTILYANRFSGVGEKPIEDPELLAVLNSTIGGAGNNVLVQLKKKMASFRNGPWYIDSRDGAVYIHNRKMSTESTYTYIYQSENGELLEASFRTVEVFKPLAGVAAALNGLTKTILHQQSQMMEFNSQPPQINLPVPGINPKYPHVKKSDYDRILRVYRDRPGEFIDRELQKLEAIAQYKDTLRDREKKKNQLHKTYKSQSPEERSHNLNILRDQAFEESNQPAMFKWVISKNPAALAAWNNYQNSLQYYKDSNNPHVVSALSEAMQEFKKVKVNTKDLPAHYSYFVRNISTNKVIVPTYAAASGNTEYTIEALEKAKAEEAQAAIRRFIEAHPDMLIMEPKLIRVTWRDVGKAYHTIGYSLASRLFVGTVRFSYYGYGTSTNVVTADRLLRDISDRYAGSKYKPSGNPSAMINNAMSNLGRKKKEKRLQASIRVVGNPILECMQQLNILNVGKKHSGLWYITSISHSLEHGQGYICDIQLSKQLPKNGSKTKKSEIHTQAYTVDNEVSDPKNQDKKRSRAKNTSKSVRPKANVVPGNSEYSYQDALNEDLTYAESAYIQARASTANSDTEAAAIISSELHNIAAHRMKQKAQGTNNPYAIVAGKDSKGNTVIEKRATNTYTPRPNKKYTSSNFDRCVQTYKRNKRKS